MIKVENLKKVYDNDFCAIDDVSFELPDKGLICITGNSGSGKSTLLNCLYGADDFEGNIYIDNILVTTKNIDAIRKKYISMIYQDFQLLEDMTVEANLRLSYESVGQTFSEESLLEILQKVGLKKHLKDSKCKELSGGEKQRVAIARALAQNPYIILADEPTGSLDSKNSKAIFELLKTLSNEFLVVVVTHNETLANEYNDYNITLCDGKIIRNNLMQENRESFCKNDLTKRKTKLSMKSFFDIFKWNFKNKTTVILLSIFSIFLLTASMVMASFVFVERNEVVLKNLKYNPEHIVSLEFNNNSDINKDFLAQYKNICFGYNLFEPISFNGTLYDGYNKDDVEYLYRYLPSGQTVVECEDIAKIGGKMLYGRNPKNEKEIAINHYTAKWMIANKHLYNGKVIENEEELLELEVSGLKIVGIIDANIKEKINLSKVVKFDYAIKEISQLEPNDRFFELVNLININFDSSVMTVGLGFAEEKGLSNNCTSVYFSSKTKNIAGIVKNADQNSRGKIVSGYTYKLDKVINFYAKNQLLFFILMIVMILCSISFNVISSYISLKERSNDILILRSISFDKSKLFKPIIISQIVLMLVLFVLALCGMFAILAILNSTIASSLIVIFKILFPSWLFIGIIICATIFSIVVFSSIYLFRLFKKSINYQKQKD